MPAHRDSEPAAAGLNQPELTALRRRAERGVTSGELPSCQLAVGYEGRIVFSETFGAPEDSRFVIFSATKPIVASVIWMLLTEGRLELERPIAADIPEFASNGKELVTLEQVLLHTGGFPYAPMAPALWNDREGRLRRFADWRLTWPAGSRFDYHATSAHWVLAELIQRATGQDFRAVVRERVLAPLKLTALALGVEPAAAGDVQQIHPAGEPPDPDELERLLGVRELPLDTDDAVLLEFNTDDGPARGRPRRRWYLQRRGRRAVLPGAAA